MSPARQYFSIILVMSTNFFFNTSLRGMEKPTPRDPLPEKQKVVRVKKTPFDAFKTQRAVASDHILRATEKELKICSGKSLLGYSAIIVIQNNFASPVIVGPELKIIAPETQKTLAVDFYKISNRLGYFELPIYDSENALIAQLDGFRNRIIPGKKFYMLGTQFATFYTDGDAPVSGPIIEGKRDYFLVLELSGTKTIAGAIKLQNDSFTYEEKNSSPTPKIALSASSCSLSKHQDGKTTKNLSERQPIGIPQSQSSTVIESKKPVFPNLRRGSVVEDGPIACDHSHGGLATLKNATIRALKRTGSLIKLADDQPRDSHENAKNKAEH